MIWKVYKTVAQTVLKCVATALFHRNVALMRAQLTDLHRLDRIVQGIRKYHSFHPSIVERTYGSVDAYLKQHLCREDWQFWTGLDAPASVSLPSMQGV